MNVLDDQKPITRNTYTFRTADNQVTAAVHLDSTGDIFIYLKPHGKYTEDKMYSLLEKLGFHESLEPFKDI